MTEESSNPTPRYLVTFKAGQNCRLSDTRTITTQIYEDVFTWWKNKGWEKKHPSADWAILIMVCPIEVKNEVEAAMRVITSAINDDPGYAWAWQCNIAMSAVDEGVDHETANRAGARFMRLCWGVDVTAFPEWQEFERGWAEYRKLNEVTNGQG